jgi:hypothetical protein
MGGGAAVAPSTQIGGGAAQAAANVGTGGTGQSQNQFKLPFASGIKFGGS